MPVSQSPHGVRSAQPSAGVPRHVAIIMDGNGRWAKARGLPRFEGHRNGVEAVRRAVKSAMQRGIRYLTVYSFSSENWRRPPDEVAMLMGLLKLYIRNDLADLDRNGVKVRVIGERDNLSPDIAALIAEAEARTKDNRSLTLTVAFNYGARQEIVEAARRIALDVRDGRLDPSQIDAEAFSSRLDTSGAPDPDLIIRTSGEMRLSNFLLWQCAYAELVFLPILWPDFDDAAFAAALSSYAERERRFGGVAAPAQALTAS